jgi:hypothetical protein
MKAIAKKFSDIHNYMHGFQVIIRFIVESDIMDKIDILVQPEDRAIIWLSVK